MGTDDPATSHREAQSRYRRSPKGRAAQRRWRADNPDKVRASREGYYYKRGGREQDSIRHADASIARLTERLAEWEAATTEQRRAIIGGKS